MQKDPMRLEREFRSEALFSPFIRLKDWFWTFSGHFALRRKRVQNACLGAHICVSCIIHYDGAMPYEHVGLVHAEHCERSIWNQPSHRVTIDHCRRFLHHTSGV
jgi:hypothetical protein